MKIKVQTQRRPDDGKSRIPILPVSFEVEPIALHGFFAAHNSIIVSTLMPDELTTKPDAYSITHVPSGFSLFTAIQWKSIAIGITKDLDELVRRGGIDPEKIKSSAMETAQLAFNSDFKAYYAMLRKQIQMADKASDINSKALLDAYFPKKEKEQLSLLKEPNGTSE